MKRLLLLALSASLLACTSTPINDDPNMTKAGTDLPATAVETNPNGAPKEVIIAAKPEVPPPQCARYGTVTNFNDQRIVAFQKIVQLQILRIKVQTMTQESTQELADLETLRRRVSYPLLRSQVRPQVVTKALIKEGKNLVAILELRRKNDPQAEAVMQELTQQFLPSIDSPDQWNCLEKQNDFKEDEKKEED